MDFNESINEINISDPFAEIDALPEEYMATLNVSGVMATIEIPVVNISMPVFHGTSSSVLDRGAGHLAGTSFPIGGEGTHAVITAHSGLSNARMFTDLLDNRVYIGDYFFINVLDQRLAYRVIQIDTVTPDDVELIYIAPGEDFVTLITCTPLAQNTHRLLVRGTRVPYIRYMADAIEPTLTLMETNWRMLTAFGAFLGFLIIFALYQLIRILRSRWKRKALAHVPVAPAFGFEDDPYIVIPHTAKPAPPPLAPAPAYSRVVKDGYIYERVTPLQRFFRTTSRRKAEIIRRRLAFGMAILTLLVGGGIFAFPRVQRAMYDRYADALIEGFMDEVEEARNFLQRRWMNETASFMATINNQPIASVNGGSLVMSENGEVVIGNFTVPYTSQLSVGPDGYLTLAGQPLGDNGHITIRDITIAHNGSLTPLTPDMPYDSYEETGPGDITGLYQSPDGNLYIHVGGGLYIGTNGGNVSLGSFNLCDAGNLFLNNTYIGNLITDSWPYYEFDLDFIFNFDLDQDPMHWLNNQMTNHNDVLYESEQEAFVSLEATEEVDFSITQTAGISDEMLGFISIEAINLRIPIFAGATERNMLRGAAHMTHTSLPVGGPSTNSVITAHRGLSRARMFRYICELVPGDVIEITNSYQTLRYAVTGYDVINDVIAVEDRANLLIQEGIDMITLFTCHPYRINSQRLLVFAVRIPD